MAAAAMLPETAFAYSFNQHGNWQGVCPQLGGFTQRVISCIKDNILYATNDFLDDFFQYMFGILAALLTLAVALWGLLMATGHRRAPVQGAFTLAMKSAVLIMLFTGTAFNFPILFGMILDGMEGLLNTITFYATYGYSFWGSCYTYGGGAFPGGSMGIWYSIDCALDAIIGRVLPGTSVAAGIAGFFLAAALSTTAGIFVGFMGFFLIVDLLFAIFRAVYIFIMAYMAVAVMAIVAPIFLPMLLFSVTRGYFEKWLKLTLGFVLQPVFLFAYLAMLLAALDAVIFSPSNPMSLYSTLAGGRSTSTFHTNQNEFRIGWWLQSEAYGRSSVGKYAVNVNTRHATPFDMEELETGVAGKVAEAKTQSPLNPSFDYWDKTWWQDAGHANIYEALGISNSFFMIDFPTEVVYWRDLACANRPPGPCNDPNITTNYVTHLFLSLIMALCVVYIFKLMLDFLPFIGIGIVGDVLSTPHLGYDRFSPPGEGFIKNLRSKLAGG